MEQRLQLQRLSQRGLEPNPALVQIIDLTNAIHAESTPRPAK
jgi:hypothetical protein